MAARAGLGAVCRRLWQGTGHFSVNSSKSSTARNGGFLLSTNMKWIQFSNLYIDIPKDLAKPEITVSDEPDTLYKRLSVLVKGHDKAVLDSYEYFAVLAAKELGLSIKVHEPPRKIERFTLLKSVHIYKKHRVQYEMRTLYRRLELEHLTGSTADVYLEYIQRNLPEGVAMEVTKWLSWGEPKRKTEGKWCLGFLYNVHRGGEGVRADARMKSMLAETEQDNTIDFLEYVAALNLVLRGTLEHKLKWTFKIYDKDRNGCIDHLELLDIVQAIYKLKKTCRVAMEAEQLLTPEEVVDRIFLLVDENGDGQLSLTEFLEGARRDEWVMKMLQVDGSPSGWISQQRRRSAMF